MGFDLISLAASFKDGPYEDESEYRVIIPGRVDAFPKVRPGLAYPLPYMEIDMGKESLHPEHYGMPSFDWVEEVIVGRGRYQAESAKALGIAYPVTVSQSCITYRY